MGSGIHTRYSAHRCRFAVYGFGSAAVSYVHSGSNRKDQKVPTAHWRLIAATNLYVASSKLEPIFQFNSVGYNYPGWDADIEPRWSGR